MTPDQYQEIAITLLAPVVTAVLGVLGLAFGDWRQRRTEAGRRKLALEDANRQVSFAAEWLKAKKLVADSPEAEQEAATRAGAWLEEASALVAASKPPPIDERPAITLRRLLLLYPLQRRASRVIRGAFYLSLGLVPIWVGFVLGGIFADLGYLPVDIVGLIALVLLAMGLRFWAERVEKSGPEGQKRHRVTLRRALLFYRFDRPAAKIVRIIFYAWTLFVVMYAYGTVIDEPRYIPSGVSYLVGFVGYAVALRFWATSLEARRKDNGVSVASSATIVGESPVQAYERASKS
jgi:hypothetical protein